jgi:tRNA pseudouridine38-40 synthase
MGSDPRTTVCRIRSTRVERRGAVVVVDVVADHFLRHMVRMMVGTLLLVGSGRSPASGVADVLASRDSQRAGKVVAPDGLYLMKVWYPGGGD